MGKKARPSTNAMELSKNGRKFNTMNLIRTKILYKL